MAQNVFCDVTKFKSVHFWVVADSAQGFDGQPEKT